ncbi:MAG: lytic transglycosylase domain-containing protein [bacterium]|nr:lytic transglycosylase domain-containing protein [bacterium]
MRNIINLSLHYEEKAWFFSTGRILRKFLNRIFVVLTIAFIFTTGKFLLLNQDISEEISQLNIELQQTREKLDDLKVKYYTVAEEYLVNEKLKRIILSINPIVSDQNTGLWISMLKENDQIIYSNLNEYSLNKLDVSQTNYSISAGTSFLTSVAALESDFRMNAVSRKGAYGPMQISNITAKHIGLTDHKDPETNMNAGAVYLSDLLEKYYEYPDQLELALASYNAGSTRVLRDWVPEWGSNWLGIHDGLIESGRQFKETRNYVRSIIGLTHMLISGEWQEQDKYFWSKYKYHMRNFDLANLYDNSELINTENSEDGGF